MLEKIVEYASLSKDDVVLEVGAGSGHLTVELAERAGRVFAVERDRDLCAVLRRRVRGYGNVEVVEGDALTVSLPEFNKAVSNLPYSISRGVTVRLISHGFREAILLYQLEFAAKLTARPGSNSYRFISALAQSTCSVEVLMDVPKSAFKPQPRVSSSLVKLIQRFRPEDDYMRFLQGLFNHKNKFLRNVLCERTPEGWESRKPVEIPPGEFPPLWELFKKTAQ